MTKLKLNILSAAVAVAFSTVAGAQPAARAPGAASAPMPASLAYAGAVAAAPAPSAAAPVVLVSADTTAATTNCHPTSCANDATRAHAIHHAAPRAKPVVAGTFDLAFNGDVAGALKAIQGKQPQLTILPATGAPKAIPVTLVMHDVTLVDALRVVGERAGEAADVIYNQPANAVRLAYHAAPLPLGNDAAAEARRWQAGGSALPVMGQDGVLRYPFGQGQVTLVCQPLRGCDIELQAGEVINNVVPGDSVRWIAGPAKTGDGALAIQHVVLKPTEAGLDTNLLITTNRRSYRLSLRSSESGYTSAIGYYYPQDMVQDWNGAAELERRKAEDESKRKVADLPITSIEQLNLDGYTVEGDSSLAWYPKRVFDDGTHVWLQMPASMRSNEAPALVLLDAHGDSELVNYRVKDAEQGGVKVTYYIVDKLFDRAALIVGVGRDQRKVEILKAKRAGSWFSRADTN